MKPIDRGAHASSAAHRRYGSGLSLVRMPSGRSRVRLLADQQRHWASPWPLVRSTGARALFRSADSGSPGRGGISSVDDLLPDQALVQITRHDHRPALAPSCQRARTAQVELPLGFDRPVALLATGLQERQDVVLEAGTCLAARRPARLASSTARQAAVRTEPNVLPAPCMIVIASCDAVIDPCVAIV